MQPIRWKSYALVIVQFACLVGIAVTGPLLGPAPWMALGVGALALGVWALLTVRLQNVQVLPDPKAGARLVRHGPYRWVRHPMYTAVLLGALALVLIQPSALRWLLWLILLADLLIKLYYEEGLLVQHFAGYAEYQAESKRLIPYLY